MRYEITHTTTYEYSHSVSLSHHSLRLHPRNLSFQDCHRHHLHVEPPPSIKRAHEDYHGNTVLFVTMERAHQHVTFKSVSVVDVSRPNIPAPTETPAWESVRDFCRGPQTGATLEAAEFVFDSPLVRTNDLFAAYALGSFKPGRPVFEGVLDLTRRIHSEFRFDSTATTIATPLEEVFKNKRGVCQDFAQVQIACLRSLGLPARYVSGYLETDPPPGRPRMAGADASHAWVSFYCHGIGWIGVDPTNNVVPTTRHVTVAWGRDFSDVSPVRGIVLGGGKHELHVSVDVIGREAPAPVE